MNLTTFANFYSPNPIFQKRFFGENRVIDHEIPADQGHGGEVSIESEVGKGPCFTLRRALSKAESIQVTMERNLP